MSNKHFALLIFLILVPFFGWLYYDSRNGADAIRKESVRRDLLPGSKAGVGAQIQYLFHFPDPVYSHSLDTSQIEALSQAGGGTEHYHVYGLTQAAFKMEALYEFNFSKKWFKEEYAMWVENLRVDFSYNTVNVFVTSAYPEGSCEYQATLEHENQHVEVHRKVYQEYQKILEQALANAKDIPLEAHPVTVPSREEGKERIGKMISSVTDQVFTQFNQALDDQQGQLDSPQSYAELRGRCKGW